MSNKDIKELYDQLCKEYSIDQVSQDSNLAGLYQYLKIKTDRVRGNYEVLPPARILVLINTYLPNQNRKATQAAPCHA